MTVIKSQTDFFICLVVIVGLLFEWFNKTWLMDNTNYFEFYVLSSGIRAVLLALSALVIYKVKGSVLLWVFMFFNLCAIFMNIQYTISTQNYYMLHDFRQNYFANLYRLLEALILLWTGRNALSHLPHITCVILHRVRFMVTRGYIHLKAKRI